MKNKHMDILQKTEQQLMEELSILKDPNVGNKRKTEAKRNIKNYEKYLKDNSDEEINGKKYPARMYHSDDKPMNKKELYKLIDSVDTPKEVPYPVSNLSGAYVSSDRTTEFPRTSILDLYNTK